MAMVKVAWQDEVWLVTLDPAQGAETQKTRPCLVVSPDAINSHLQTLIVAPMTTVSRPYPSRVSLVFGGKRGQVALDQLRAIDRSRLVKKLGTASAITAKSVAAVLVEMFEREG